MSACSTPHLPWRSLVVAVAGVLVLSGGRVHAQVVLDNFTLGDLTDDMNLDLDASNTFNITEDFGQRAGANLFHSFRAFSIAAGETALFSGDPAIANVISRVTGGESSVIDGTISSSIDGANFWIVNPAGMIFGANAVIDVGGTFNAGAADFVAFPGGVQYSAIDGSVTLSVASPTDFGFLDTGGGSGTMQIGPDPSAPGFSNDDAGVDFDSNAGRYTGLSFAGRSLTVTNSLLGSDAGQAAEGDIRLSSPRLEITNSTIYADTAGALAAGSIFLSGGTIVVAGTELSSQSAGGGGTGLPGSISVLADERAEVHESLLTTESFSDVVELGEDLPGEITIDAGLVLEVTGSFITADNLANGAAGQIDLGGDVVILLDTVLTSGSEAPEGGTGAGVAGVVEIGADSRIELRNTLVTTRTYSDAQIDYGEGEIELADVPGSIEIETDGELLAIDSDVEATSFGRANAGLITLSGDTVELRGAEVASTSEADEGGWAGDILISGVRGVVIEGSSLLTETRSRLDNPEGAITVTADYGALVIRDSSASSDTYGASNAGQIDIGGTSVTLDGARLTSRSLDETNTATAGAAGIVEIGAEPPEVPGEAPAEPGDYFIEIRDSTIETVTNSDVNTGSNDPDVELEDVPGSIEIVTVGELRVAGSQITATTTGQADAGFIELSGRSVRLEVTEIASSSNAADGGWAGDILVSGVAGVSLEGTASNDDSTLTRLHTDTDSLRVNSEGTIEVVSENGPLLIRNADLTATTSGASNAGFVDLRGLTIRLEDTVMLSTSTTEQSGAAGIITLQGTDSIVLVRSDISTDTDSSVPVFSVVEIDGESVRTELIGFIEVSVSNGDFQLSDSEIASKAFGDASAGYVRITAANDATIEGGPELRASITTRSDRSRGGDIILDIDGDLDIVGGLIEATAGEQGNGGNVIIDAAALFIRDSGIFARADQGNGGEIVLSVTGSNLLFVIDSESLVNADSDSGINGDVDINAPDADLAASLQQQDANIVVAPELAADACSPAATGELSTFVQEDEGGTPAAPDRYLNARIPVTAASPLARQRVPADRAGVQLAAVASDPSQACR